MASSNLVLHLKYEYYDAIERGEKKFEYRGLHWVSKLENRQYEKVVLWRGFQAGRFMLRRWKGVKKEVITHPHFGNVPTEVYAIDVTEEWIADDEDKSS
jgi:hypothetical protein